MSWLLPSLPALPGWSSAPPLDASVSDRPSQGEHEDGADEDEDLDKPPMFPLPNSAQRSQAPPRPTAAPTPPPTFALAPPSPDKASPADPPSDLNIAILPDAVPLGNMAPPPSTTSRPAFGIQPGGSYPTAGPSLVAPKSKRRGKVALAPGHSALDWARLAQSGQDLRGTSSFPVRVTLEELKKHNKRDDAWSAFNGRVYNLTAYLPFHPGGVDELMRVAGRDGTKLFMLTHSWVNLEYTLQECCIGMLVRG